MFGFGLCNSYGWFDSCVFVIGLILSGFMRLGMFMFAVLFVLLSGFCDFANSLGFWFWCFRIVA